MGCVTVWWGGYMGRVCDGVLGVTWAGCVTVCRGDVGGVCDGVSGGGCGRGV